MDKKGKEELRIINQIKDKLQKNNLIVTKADKGSSILVIYCDEYEHKVNNFISNNEAIEINDNPTAKFQKDVRITLNECRHIIDTNNKWRYINLNPSTPVMRGLVKIHKEDTPVRPIVNFKNAPTYNLAKTLTKVLKKYIPLPHVYNVHNSVHLMEDLTNAPYNPNLRTASLDISNMYTNIPIKKLLNINENTCENNGLESALKQEILTLTGLVVTQNYFKFQNKTYIQKSGLAMGAPSSSILSEIYLQFLENTKIFEILQNRRILQICQRHTYSIQGELQQHRRSL